jgi:hypothetical protein
MSAKTTANVLVKQGRIIGAKLEAVADALQDACYEAGPGMPPEARLELVKSLLDAITDAADAHMYADAARDLIVAEAKLEAIGLHASKTDRKLWRDKADECFGEVATERQVA